MGVVDARGEFTHMLSAHTLPMQADGFLEQEFATLHLTVSPGLSPQGRPEV